MVLFQKRVKPVKSQILFSVIGFKVRIRLLRSFVPRRPSQMTASPDLYGPSMVVLTMVALLLFNMKSSG